MKINPQAFFKMLADTTRLRALVLMQSEGELCVCELTHALQLSQPKISRHLAQLREAGLVRARREGLWMHYRVNPTLPDWTLNILRETLSGLQNNTATRHDLERLLRMPDRPGVACCA